MAAMIIRVTLQKLLDSCFECLALKLEWYINVISSWLLLQNISALLVSYFLETVADFIKRMKSAADNDLGPPGPSP